MGKKNEKCVSKNKKVADFWSETDLIFHSAAAARRTYLTRISNCYVCASSTHISLLTYTHIRNFKNTWEHTSYTNSDSGIEAVAVAEIGQENMSKITINSLHEWKWTKIELIYSNNITFNKLQNVQNLWNMDRVKNTCICRSRKTV